LALDDSGTLVLMDPLSDWDSLPESLCDSLLELAESLDALSLDSLPLESLWLTLDPLE